MNGIWKSIISQFHIIFYNNLIYYIEYNSEISIIILFFIQQIKLFILFNNILSTADKI